MEMTLDTKVVRTSDQVSSELADSTVILQLRTGQYYSLNESAAFIWLHLNGPTTVRDLVSLQLEQFDAPRAVVERDAIALLSTMREAGLIQTEEADADA